MSRAEFAARCKACDPLKNPQEALNLLQEAAKLAEQVDELKEKLAERKVKKILCKKFKETYKYALTAPVVGHQEEQLEELVRCLDIKAFEAELFERIDKKS